MFTRIPMQSFSPIVTVESGNWMKWREEMRDHIWTNIINHDMVFGHQSHHHAPCQSDLIRIHIGIGTISIRVSAFFPHFLHSKLDWGGQWSTINTHTHSSNTSMIMTFTYVHSFIPKRHNHPLIVIRDIIHTRSSDNNNSYQWRR